MAKKNGKSGTNGAKPQKQTTKPNILVIWGDDIA
jgi:hypothetical protein